MSFFAKRHGEGGYKMSLKSITSVVLTKADWAKKCVTFYSMELQKSRMEKSVKSCSNIPAAYKENNVTFPPQI